MKKVLVVTEALDECVSVHYTQALLDSVMLGMERGLLLQPLFLLPSTPSLTLNQGLTFAVEDDCDGVVFIHRDMLWRPEFLPRICNSDKDAVGMPVYKHGHWHLDPGETARLETDSESKEIKVNSTSTDMLFVSRKAAQALYESHPVINYRGVSMRGIIQGAETFSNFFLEEEILAFRLNEVGMSEWVDASTQATHIGRLTEGPPFSKVLEELKVEL